MIVLVENNNLKLQFDETNKVLIFTDNKGYSYNISFQQKNIIKSNSACTTTTSDSQLVKSINDLSCKVNNIQNSCSSTTDNCSKEILIHHVVNTQDKLDDITSPSKNDVAIVKCTLELFIFQNNSWCHLGDIKAYNKDILTGASLLNSDNDYENICKDELKLINYHCSKTIFTEKSGNKVVLDSGTYKIKYCVCWEVDGSSVDVTNYLKNRRLFFVYNCGNIVKNSVFLSKGYPHTNTSIHEFILTSSDSMELEFIARLRDDCVDVSLYSEGCFLEIEKI